MSILKVRDKDGKVYEILALKGEKGDKGDSGTADFNNYYTKNEINGLVGDIETLLGGI